MALLAGNFIDHLSFLFFRGTVLDLHQGPPQCPQMSVLKVRRSDVLHNTVDCWWVGDIQQPNLPAFSLNWSWKATSAWLTCSSQDLMLPPKITYIISVLLQHNHELPWDTRQNHLCAHSRAPHACTHACLATWIHTHLLGVLQPIQQPILILVYLTVAHKPYSLWTMGAKRTMAMQTRNTSLASFPSLPVCCHSLQENKQWGTNTQPQRVWCFLSCKSSSHTLLPYVIIVLVLISLASHSSHCVAR